MQAGGTELPTPQSGFKLYKGLAYVVLHGTVGVLAVFRVLPDNLALRRMKSLPLSLKATLTPCGTGHRL